MSPWLTTIFYPGLLTSYATFLATISIWVPKPWPPPVLLRPGFCLNTTMPRHWQQLKTLKLDSCNCAPCKALVECPSLLLLPYLCAKCWQDFSGTLRGCAHWRVPGFLHPQEPILHPSSEAHAEKIARRCDLAFSPEQETQLTRRSLHRKLFFYF